MGVPRDELDVNFGVLPPPGNTLPQGDSLQLRLLRENMERAKDPPVPVEPLDPVQDAIDKMTEVIFTNLVGA